MKLIGAVQHVMCRASAVLSNQICLSLSSPRGGSPRKGSVDRIGWPARCSPNIKKMRVFASQDVNQLLHRCFSLYLGVRNPSAGLQDLMNQSIMLVNEITGHSPCSQDVVGQYVSVLSRLQEILQEGVRGKKLAIFRWRSLRTAEKEVEELRQRISVIRGDLHSLMNVMRSRLLNSSGAVSVLVARLGKGKNERREAAARKLAVLAVDRTTGRDIANSGGVPMLIKILDDGDVRCQIQALRALANMALSDPDNQEAILYHGGLERIGKLLFVDCKALQEQAACCLGNMSDMFMGELSENWSRAIIGLVHLLHTSVWCRVQAVRAVTGLVRHPELRSELVACGVVKPLLKLAMGGCQVTSHLAVRALAYLSIDEEISFVLAQAGAVNVLMAILKRDGLGDKCKENVMCCLANIAALEHSGGINSKPWDKGIKLLMGACTEQSAVCRRNSVLALTHLSRRQTLQEVMAKCGAIPWLVEIMRISDLASKQRAAIALANIASNRKHSSEAHTQIVAAGGVEAMAELLKSEDPLCREQACRTLARLSLRRKFHGQLLSSGVTALLLVVLKTSSSSNTCVGFATCTLAALSRTTNGLEEIRRCGGRRAVGQLGCGNVICKRNRATILTRLKERTTTSS
ncbi:hypothetical protein BSKO_11890 [Bryopsis sp. KO-2023]|nr:hypothetical protein BSKO_11890 [Bryopsis sp. KO-2023]